MSSSIVRVRLGSAVVHHVVHEARHRGVRSAGSLVRRRLLSRLNGRLLGMAYPSVRWGQGVQVDGKLRIVGFGNVEVGDGVAFMAYSGRPNEISVTSGEAMVRIGDETALNGATIVASTTVEVGRGSLLGPCFILDADTHSTAPDRRWAGAVGDAAPVRIGDDVWIGADVLILRGVTVGDHAVVGAGTVLRSDVPAGAIVVGNPQRLVGEVPQATQV